MSIGSATLVEGDTGKARSLSFPVTLSEPAQADVTVHYAITTDGSGNAADAGDFTAKSGTVKFTKSTKTGVTPTTAYVTAKVNPDITVEPDETFRVVLSTPTGGYGLGAAVATGTILNDDLTSGLRVDVGDATIVEGSAGTGNTVKVTVTLSAPAPSTVAVSVGLGVGSATSGADYKPLKAKRLTFTKGQWQKSFVIKVVPDTAAEADEILTVVLSSPSVDLVLGRSSGTVTIVDDD